MESTVDMLCNCVLREPRIPLLDYRRPWILIGGMAKSRVSGAVSWMALEEEGTVRNQGQRIVTEHVEQNRLVVGEGRS